MGWTDYDPSWLVELARGVQTEHPGLAQALAQCTRCLHESKAYVHFVDPTNANKPGAEWQFERNVLLESAVEGTIVLDVLKDGRVGGVEFLKRL